MSKPNKKNTSENFYLNSYDIDENNCWNWRRYKMKQGYGRLQWNGRMVLAHRLSWILSRGKITGDLYVCHKCDNPSCINPDHLFLATHQENMKDRNLKMRMTHGENHPRAKLTASDVKFIRDIYKQSTITYLQLAKLFEVDKAVIARAISGECWKQVY